MATWVLSLFNISAMLVLFETAAGYALFKAKESKLKGEDLSSLFATPEAAGNVVSV